MITPMNLDYLFTYRCRLKALQSCLPNLVMSLNVVTLYTVPYVSVQNNESK